MSTRVGSISHAELEWHSIRLPDGWCFVTSDREVRAARMSLAAHVHVCNFMPCLPQRIFVTPSVRSPNGQRGVRELLRHGGASFSLTRRMVLPILTRGLRDNAAKDGERMGAAQWAANKTIMLSRAVAPSDLGRDTVQPWSGSAYDGHVQKNSPSVSTTTWDADRRLSYDCRRNDEKGTRKVPTRCVERRWTTPPGKAESHGGADVTSGLLCLRPELCYST